jgi:tetratricopeptide (TPR) repeat protein
VSTLNVADPDIQGQLNQLVDAAIASFISAHDARNEPGIATFLCRQGTMHLSRLGQENFSIADTLFTRAFELEPRGLYLAWRAYLRMYLLMERQFTCRQTLVEEALAFQRRALEMEPFNSYVASLSAHVHAFMRRSYVAAYEFAQRGIQLNRANPLAWAGLGMAEAHLGRTKAGMRHTVMARELAGGTPFRFQIDGLSCIASAMAGDFDRSIWYGEASHALLPNFAPPLRYLCALYVCRGEAERAQETLEKLRTLEPDFSYNMLRDKSYPAIGLHRSNLLESLPSRQI